MNFLFKHFAKRIIIDVHPLRFIFQCSKDDFYLSVATFIYIENRESKSFLLAIGEEIPDDQLDHSDIHRINVFDLSKPLPPNTTLSRDDLIQVIFEYGIGRTYEKHLLPALRPIVFINGADRFSSLFTSPQDVFRVAAKRGGAKEVVFDKTDL